MINISRTQVKVSEEKENVNEFGSKEIVINQPEKDEKLTVTGPSSAKKKGEAPKEEAAPKAGLKIPERLSEETSELDAAKRESDRAPTLPQEDPEFQKNLEKVKKTKKTQSDHVPAGVKAKEVKKAAMLSEADQKEKNDRKQHLEIINKTAEKNEKETKSFEPKSFKKLLQNNLNDIGNNLPKSESDAKWFKNNKPLEKVKQKIGDEVAMENEKVAAPIASQVKKDPPISGLPVQTPENLRKENAGRKPRPIHPKETAPKPKYDSEISMEKESRSLDELMVEKKMTEEQLAKSNEPTFIKALDTKQQAQREANAAPLKYRKQEKKILNRAQKKAKGVGQRGFGAMFSARKDAFEGVFTKQVTTEQADKKKQKAVHEKFKAIYNQTKTDVNNILEKLTEDVDNIFGADASAAKKIFEKRVEDKLDDIYGFTVIDDWLFGEDTEAIAKVFEDEKQRFLAAMDKTLDKIANLIAGRLNAAVKRIRDGKKEAENFFKGLDEDQKRLSQDAMDFFKAQYENLEDSVNEKQHELAQTLVESYKIYVGSLEDSFDKIKEEVSKGWIDKAADFIVDVGTTLAKLYELLLSVLSRLGNLIDDILAHPIRFLENLASGIKSGFDTFIGNIDGYLISGFFEWLRGNVKGQNIKIPTKFDARGVFSLTTQLLAIDYQFFRKIAERILGKKIVSSLEKGIEFAGEGLEKVGEFAKKSLKLFRILQTKGLGALWDHVKEMIVSNVNEIFNKAKETVLYETIKKALAFIASMFTPAGAFIKAAQTLYRGLRFLVDNITRISELVNAFLDSLELAVKGNVGGIAKKVVLALKNFIIAAIDFLAKILGLGNLGQKVRGIVQALRKPIERSMEWLLKKMKPVFKRIFKAGTAFAKKGKKGFEKIKEGSEAVKGKIVEWWRIRKRFRNKANEEHTLYFGGKSKNESLMIQSRAQTIETYLNSLGGGADINKVAQAKARAAEIRTITREDVTPNERAIISQKITEISQLLIELSGGSLADADLPVKAKWSLAGEKGMEVEELSTRTSGGGTRPSGTPKGWNLLQVHGLTNNKKGDWKRMHLIPAAVGGKGSSTNLIPAPTSVNSGSKITSFESSIKNLVEKKSAQTKKPNVIWVRSQVNRFHPASTSPKYDDTTYAADLSMRAGLHFLDREVWRKDSTPRVSEDVNIPTPEFGTVQPIKINHVGRKFLEAATGIKKDIASEIIQERDLNGSFVSYPELLNRITVSRRQKGVKITDALKRDLKKIQTALVEKKITFIG